MIEQTVLVQKSCIIKSMNGREIARSTVVCYAGELAAEYEVVRTRMAALYPGNYLFCDASEGKPYVAPIKWERDYQRVM